MGETLHDPCAKQILLFMQKATILVNRILWVLFFASGLRVSQAEQAESVKRMPQCGIPSRGRGTARSRY